MNVCKLHPKLQNLWVCVERECTYRVMCSTCAVKFHDRNHKIEEINLLNQGCLSTYLSNPKNQTSTLKYLQQGSQPLIQDTIQYEDHIQQSIERSLRNVQKKIENAKQEFMTQYQQIIEEQEIKRQEVLQNLANMDESIKNNQFVIEDAFQIIKQYEQQIIPNKETTIIQRKLELLNLMRDNFMRMIKSYFHNQFIAEFCHLFDMQIESLNPQVDDIDEFLNYVDQKWHQDYRNIQLSIEKFVSRLNEGLKYLISLPLEKKLQSPKNPLKQEEPKQRKNVKIEPVSQSLQQQYY